MRRCSPRPGSRCARPTLPLLSRKASLTLPRAGVARSVERLPSVGADVLRPRLRDRDAPARPADRRGAQGPALRARIRALVDQMEAAVGRLDAWGIALRDLRTGLLDFPALVEGRQVWLCWRLGEEEVAWWHEATTGFERRQPASTLHRSGRPH
ncbi:MAG: DUF2203 domain-containing protein [Chloroflexi bacterium]|nr:DUF2203 domain-containing protein [Chloroflexota bacterium]